MEWLKQKHNQLAIGVWAFGGVCLYVIMTSPIGVVERVLNPVTAIGVVSAVIAGPVGWGVLRRRKWAKWIVVCIMIAVIAVQAGWGIAHRDSLVIGVHVLAAWGAIRLIRWDITGEVEWERRMDQMQRIHEFLEQNSPPPLSPSSVTLKVNSRPAVTRESLAAAVETGLGRKCEISSSTSNIDLGIEAACTTHESAIVGGVESASFGHLIVGANPIALEVAWTAADGEFSPDGLPISILTIGTPRQARRSESRIHGYDWTIPLAAALWTSKTRSATVDEEGLSFESVEELLAWNTARQVTD